MTDGSYDIHDLIAVNLVLDVKNENENRARAAATTTQARR